MILKLNVHISLPKLFHMNFSVGKRIVIIDGVGYPSVGSICNLSNADIARALKAPVLLVGKSGVGDAVDSFNINARFFESYGQYYADDMILDSLSQVEETIFKEHNSLI